MSRLSYGYLVPCCEYAQMPPVPSITQETGGVLEVFDVSVKPPHDLRSGSEA